MAAEIFTGLSSLKAAFDIAKGLKDIDDATNRNAAIIELQKKLLAAQADQAQLIETVSQLKKRVAYFEAWETEKERYQLTEIGSCNFAYSLKKSMSGAEPPHYLCANCYHQSKKSILHYMKMGGGGHLLTCDCCGAKNITHSYRAPSYADTSEHGA
jgi:hypothetical protein